MKILKLLGQQEKVRLKIRVSSADISPIYLTKPEVLQTNSSSDMNCKTLFKLINAW